MTEILKNILYFFSLEALDARIFPTNDPEKRKQISSRIPSKSRWGTVEFKFYLLCFLVIVPFMFKQAMDISQETHPNYENYQALLSDGWLFGRKVDNSDIQYNFFRNNFYLLLILMSVHLSVKKIIVHYLSLANKLTFDLFFGFIFIFFAYGFNSFKLLFHIIFCFIIVRVLLKNDKTKERNRSNDGLYSSDSQGKIINYYRLSAIWFLWIYGILALYVNDRYRDLRFYGSIHSNLTFLDDMDGIISRWDVFYNFVLLRTISYNMDYIYRFYELKNANNGPIELKDNLNGSSSGNINDGSRANNNNDLTTSYMNNSDLDLSTYDISELSEKQRQNYPWNLEYYNFQNYLSYILYTPLFIAGPVLTFNDYMYQSMKSPLRSINLKRIGIYALRFLFCLLTMEFVLHYMYVVAISKIKNLNYNEYYTPFQISMIGLFNLNIIWLKLLIPWRFFRLWGLLDEIDAPENMIRCVDNNYSAMGFWRAWHRSFNRWVTKYLYIPLGGKHSRFLSSLAIFSFVAIWHDIELRLLIWGWLIVAFLLPEILVGGYFHKAIKPQMEVNTYRYISSVGSVANIWMMMIANIYGFCLGHNGTINLLKNMFQTVDGGVFFFTASASLFVGVQIMNELRESEMRRFIDVRC